MENFIVSARKYRPSTFDTVIGQKGLTTTLKNAIREDKLAHAYLFCGPRGVGKTTCARIFAKTINCDHLTPDGEACNECESCRAFNEGRSLNIHELDAASNNSVEDIRSLIDQVRIPPQVGRYKVFIIDEVHMLSTAAFNAFLKTLEEPPAYAKFILATTERHKVLPTILSRCQVYDFYRISVGDMVDHLRSVAAKEGVTAEEQALMVIAQKADGGMRDALSIFDQMVSYSAGNLTYKSVIDNLNILDYDYFFRFTDLFLENKTSDCILLFNEILSRGFDGGNFIGGLASHLRDLLVSHDAVTLPLLDVGEEMRNRYQEQAARCPQKFLYKAIRLCNDCDLNYRISRNKRLLVELTLIQLSQLTSDDADDASAGRRPVQLKPIFGTAQPAAPASLPKNSTQPAVSNTPSNPSTPNNPNTQSTPQAPIKVQKMQKVQGAEVQQPSQPKLPQRSRLGTVSIRAKKVDNPTAEAPNAPTGDKANEMPLPQESKENTPAPDKPFNEEDMQIAWRTFAASLPREDIATAGRMNALLPHLKEDGVTFSVSVANNLIESDLRKKKTAIEAYMRKELHNSLVTMEIVVSEAAVSARLLTPRQQYEEMVKENPNLQLLMSTFDLDLI